MSAVEVVDDYLGGLPGSVRRLAHAEWGLSLETGDHPLDLGLRIADELVRAQAWAVRADPALDPWLLLHWNRQTRVVRFGSTRAGDVWVHGDIPVAALDARAVDRLLGLVVEGATRAREYAEAAAAAGAGSDEPAGTWLSGAASRRPAGD